MILRGIFRKHKGLEKRIKGVENKDKENRIYAAYRAFACKEGLSLRERFLLFRLVELYGLGMIDQRGIGGVQRLSDATGFSKGSLSNTLKALVDKGALVEGRALTNGRPIKTYSLAPVLKDAVLSASPQDFHAPWLARVLGSGEPIFSELSISERTVLAILWGLLPNPCSCVLDDWSVPRLSKLAGVNKSTFSHYVGRLAQMKMLAVPDAEFASDGARGKTKVYFLLGPAVIKCWPRAYTWRFDLTGMLGWFAGIESQFSAQKLMRRVDSRVLEVSKIEAGIRADLLELLSDAASRDYVLHQCCAAISHAFSLDESDFLNADILYPRVQSALLRLLRVPVLGRGSHHRAIENMDLGALDFKSQVLHILAEEISICLVGDLKSLLSFAPSSRDLGQGSRHMVCYVVGEGEARKMRFDLVTDDIDAGDKFGARLRALYQQGLLDLPDQLLLEADH